MRTVPRLLLWRSSRRHLHTSIARQAIDAEFQGELEHIPHQHLVTQQDLEQFRRDQIEYEKEVRRQRAAVEADTWEEAVDNHRIAETRRDAPTPLATPEEVKHQSPTPRRSLRPSSPAPTRAQSQAQTQVSSAVSTPRSTAPKAKAKVSPRAKAAQTGSARQKATRRTPSVKPFIEPYTPVDGTAPLLSRYDWRLSSPLQQVSQLYPTDPRNLALSPRQGLNRLIGVGPEPAREFRRGKHEFPYENWAWKVRHTDGPDTWAQAERYRERFNRLLDLTEAEMEANYIQELSRGPSVAEREEAGTCIDGAMGRWLGKAKERADEARTVAANPQNKTEIGKSAATVSATATASDSATTPHAATTTPSTANPAMIYSEWYVEGVDLSPEGLGYAFEPRETTLRFVALREGPVSPEEALGAPQGTFQAFRHGRIVVSFSTYWEIEPDVQYRIDIGYDSGAIALQRQALDCLFYDAAQIKAQNAIKVQRTQDKFRSTGTTSEFLTLKAIVGTQLRELLVPEDEEASDGIARMPDLDGVDEEAGIDWDVAREADWDAAVAVAGAVGAAAEVPVAGASASLTPESSLFTNLRTRPHNPSQLFRDDLYINSWIQRYRRPNPIRIPGDPDLGLNPSQIRAVAMSLSERVSLIQGPPGTGKSKTIIAIVKLLKKEWRVPFPILVTAPTHVTVDVLLRDLIDEGLNAFRLGKLKRGVSSSGKALRSRFDEVAPWLVEERARAHPLWNSLEYTREQSLETAQSALVAQHRMSDPTLSATQRREALREFEALTATYQKLWAQAHWYENRLYSSLFASADVVCSTALGAATSKILDIVDFPMVFLDEAAMCTEPTTLTPLMKGCEQLTLIGDHKQLPAVVTSQEAKNDNLHRSMFERLIEEDRTARILLDTQYRMVPAISKFSNQQFYSSSLMDDTSTKKRRRVRSVFGHEHVFLNHDFAEIHQNQSVRNEKEAHIIVHIVGDILARNSNLNVNDIAIVSPYLGQTHFLRKLFSSGDATAILMTGSDPLLKKRSRPFADYTRALELQKIEINTIDGFQGREKKIIIFSSVRNNSKGFIGFLNDKRRLNVALTRAKDQLIVVGSEKTLRLAALRPKVNSHDAYLAHTGEGVVSASEFDSTVWSRYLDHIDKRVFAWEDMKAKFAV